MGGEITIMEKSLYLMPCRSIFTLFPIGTPREVTMSKKLTKKQLQYFKDKLLAEKNKVLEEMDELQQSNLKQSISDSSGENSRYSYHLGDVASLSYGREFSMGLAERQQKYLEQIDEALERIEEGVYGMCKVTGEPIPVERLEEVPVAKYSVKGKEILERRKRQGG
jgi:DnaK suppressor protein